MSEKRGSVVRTAAEAATYSLSEKVRKSVAGVLGLGMVATTSFMTLGRVELTPLAKKESEISATVERPAMVTSMEGDPTTPAAIVKIDAASRVAVSNGWRVSEGLPLADQINKGAEKLDAQYFRTFNEKGGNPITATIGASGAMKVTINPDAPRRSEGDAGDSGGEYVAEVEVPELSVRFIDEGMKPEAFSGSNSLVAGAKRIGDVIEETKSGKDITTDSESMRAMMDEQGVEVVRQVLLKNCMIEEGDARNKILGFSKDQLTDRVIKDFKRHYPDDSMTRHDVKFTFGLEEKGEKSLNITDENRQQRQDALKGFSDNLRDKGFEVNSSNTVFDKGCEVSDAVNNKINDAGKLVEAGQ